MKRLTSILVAAALLVSSCSQAGKERAQGGPCDAGLRQPRLGCGQAVDETEALGKADLTIIDSQNQQSAQDLQVETFFQKGLAAIAIEPVDINSLGPLIDKAKTQRTPIVFFDRMPSDQTMRSWDKLFFVGKRTEAGAALGESSQPSGKATPQPTVTRTAGCNTFSSPRILFAGRLPPRGRLRQELRRRRPQNGVARRRRFPVRGQDARSGRSELNSSVRRQDRGGRLRRCSVYARRDRGLQGSRLLQGPKVHPDRRRERGRAFRRHGGGPAHGPPPRRRRWRRLEPGLGRLRPRLCLGERAQSDQGRLADNRRQIRLGSLQESLGGSIRPTTQVARLPAAGFHRIDLRPASLPRAPANAALRISSEPTRAPAMMSDMAVTASRDSFLPPRRTRFRVDRRGVR